MNARRALSLFLWLGLLSLAWPLIHLTVAILRFGQSFAGGFAETFVFLPMGALSGGLLLYLVERSQLRSQKMLTVAGYLLAAPIAFAASLGGGLILQPLIGVPLFGGMPLAGGAVLGYFVGRYFNKAQS